MKYMRILLWVGELMSMTLSGTYSISLVPPANSSLAQPPIATNVTEVLAQTAVSVIASTSSTCTARTGSLLGAPLDGLTQPSFLTQSVVRWGPVVFPSGGNFTLCFTSGTAGTHLPIKILVSGIIGVSNKVFCAVGSPSCIGQLAVNPLFLSEAPMTRLALTGYPLGACGVTGLASPSFGTSSNLGGLELFDMSVYSQSVSAPVTLTACFCPGYMALGNMSSLCSSSDNSPVNYVQKIGSLIFLSLQTWDPNTGSVASIYPSLKFTLTVRCGSGGCASSPRIKIVDSSPLNDRSYFDPSGGCRAAQQSLNYLGPANCVNSTICQMTRTDNASSNDVSFANIQLWTNFLNFVRPLRFFDVCFCDAACTKPGNWMFAGSLPLLPLSVKITVKGVSSGTVVWVNKQVSITIFGSNSPGSFRSSGTLSREMKLLSDNSRSASASRCFSSAQSPAVTGHSCYSLTDCTLPFFSSSTAITYGNDDIAVSVPGWMAVCFCNEQCNAGINWIVVGWVLVAGPNPNQKWSALQGLPFTLNVTGFGFSPVTDVKFVNSVPASSCSSSPPASTVFFSPAAGSSPVLIGANIVSFTDFGGSGTLVTFASAHGLSDGDTVRLTGVVAGDTFIDLMVNNFHQVSLVDAFRIEIPLSFPAGKFPFSINAAGALWVRTNFASFSPITSSTAPASYSVCIGGSLAGTLLVASPSVVSGSIGLGTIVPYVVAPIVLQFTTSSSKQYRSVFGKTVMKISFSNRNFLEPKDSSGLPLSVVTLSGCGSLLLEFSGPLPFGCYADTDNIYVVFNELNGVGSAQTISIVINAVRKPGLSPTNPAGFGPVQVWMLTDSLESAIEMIALRPTSSVVQPAGFVPDEVFFNILSSGVLTAFCSVSCAACTSVSDCAHFKDQCVSPASSVCSKTTFSIRFQLKVNSGGSIPAGSSLRIFFSPALDWNFQSNPVVTCAVSPSNSTPCSSSSLSAFAENSVSGIGFNVLRIQLPQNMAPLTSGASSQFVFTVQSLKLPTNGFFPSFFQIEITPVQLLLSSSIAFFATPQVQAASLLSTDGNKHPFRGDTNNIVFVKLNLGLRVSSRASLIIGLPEGYNCASARNNAWEIPSSGLNEFVGKIPSGRGVIGNVDFASTSSSLCVLELKPTTTLFSDASIYISLNVDNPKRAMQQSEVKNVWTVQVVQNGVSSFISPFSNSLAVLGLLGNVSITSTDFGSNNQNDIFVFFTSESFCNGTAPFLEISAPEFHFGSNCLAFSLPDSYLVADTRNLPIGSCNGFTAGSARISLTAPLEAEKSYGFRIRALNPSYAEGRIGWRLATYSDASSACDASAIQNKSLVFPFSAKCEVYIASMTPLASSLITIFFSKTPAVESIRITAPQGFLWDFNASDVVTNLPLTALPIVPLKAPFNELKIDYLSPALTAGANYSFSSKIRIPRNSPVNAANAFLIQLGSAAAALVEAPLVNALINGSIAYRTSIAGEANLVCFQVRLVSPVPRSGKIFIVPPSASFRAITCEIAGGQSDFPTDAVCFPSVKGDNIEIIAGLSGIEAKLVRFCIPFENPNRISPIAGSWSIATSLDAATSIAGFPITSRIIGGIHWTGDRNDRPFAMNQILIHFSPTAPVASLSVRAPEGFVFPRYCLCVLTSWPDSISIDCVGANNVAFLSLSGALPAGYSYEFKIGVMNPETTPLWNFWTVECGKTQASTPFAGFQIWAFLSASVKALDQSANVLTNVTLSLTPFNTIPPFGALNIEAPVGFVVSAVCETSTPRLTCSGNPGVPNLFTITLGAASSMTAGVSFSITVVMRNPKILIAAQKWRVTSVQKSGGPVLDTIQIDGYRIVGSMMASAAFSLKSISSLSGGDRVILNIAFQVKSVKSGDSLAIRVPLGYMLNLPGSAVCAGYFLNAPLSLIKSPKCVGNFIQWTDIDAYSTFPNNAPLVVSLTSKNPACTSVKNFFSIYRRNADNELLEMAVFSGPALIPKLENVVVDFAIPAVRQAGGVATYILSFTPFSPADTLTVSARVGNASFVFFTANFSSSVTLSHVVNPACQGPSFWTISTFLNGVLADQIVDVLGPVILGAISVNPTASSVVPNTYGARSALISVWLSCSVNIPAGSVLAIKPPTGYSLLPGSFETLSGIAGSDQGYSVDNDNVFIVSLTNAISPEALSGFAIRANLPETVEQASNWLFQFLFQDSLLATNDGLFKGFSLIASIPFGLFPTSFTPSAQIVVKISYSVPNAIVADQSSSSVSMQISAPVGFVFPSSASCLVTSPGWIACIGSGNTAIVQREASLLPEGPGTVRIIVTNPSSTPENNDWRLVVFINKDVSASTNIDSNEGFAIRSMSARYNGQNRLGFSGVGFFTFQLSRGISTFLQVLIAPGLFSGYKVACGKYIVGLKRVPSCTPASGSGIILTISQEELNAAYIFTLAVTVTNPHSRPTENVFTVTVLDPLGSTVDANAFVEGETLVIVPITQNGFDFDQAYPRTLTKVVFTFSLQTALTADLAKPFTWISVVIQAPNNFMLAASKTVIVDSALSTTSIGIAGNTLRVFLDPSSPLKGGAYTISFPVMNPGSIPISNFWTFKILSGANTVIFSNVSEGYQFGTEGGIIKDSRLLSLTSQADPIKFKSVIFLLTVTLLR